MITIIKSPFSYDDDDDDSRRQTYYTRLLNTSIHIVNSDHKIRNEEAMESGQWCC